MTNVTPAIPSLLPLGLPPEVIDNILHDGGEAALIQVWEPFNACVPSVCVCVCVCVQYVFSAADFYLLLILWELNNKCVCVSACACIHAYVRTCVWACLCVSV